MPESEQAVDVAEIESALGDTLGEKKAAELLEKAMEEAAVGGPQLEQEAAFEVLDIIGEMDVSSLASVAANTTKTQLRR